MRTGHITINGEKHLLCFSLYVVRECTERYGSVEGFYEALSSDDTVKALEEAVWGLSTMMEAGAKYAEFNKQKNPRPLSTDELFAVCDVSDFAAIRASIADTVLNGQKTSVEAESSKNA